MIAKNRFRHTDLEDNLDEIRFTEFETCAHCGQTSKKDVTIVRPKIDNFDGHQTPWTVIYCGAVDFEGNKKDMLTRYTQFKGLVSDLK